MAPERSDTSRRFRTDRRLPSGRHGLPRSFIVRDQRERILDAMGQAVAAKGYVATTVADITATAGVSRTTFYALFSDKEDCFLATYEAASTILFERTAAAAAQDGTWEERLQRGIRAFLETLESEPALSHTCIVEAPAAGPQALERVAQAQRGFVNLILSAEGAPDADSVPDLSASFFIGGLYDVVYNCIRTDGGSLTALEPQLVEIALRLLRP
jgi:AcrR family transcriptional regulator